MRPGRSASAWAGLLRVHGWRILAICLLALLAYSNSFQCGLALDNASVIGRDTRIREATPENLRLIFTQDYWYGRAETNLYRPFTTLTYLFNYAVLGSGPKPASYHWVNFAIHAANIALVYLLGLILLRETRLAAALAAIWAVHPVLTESVTNIVGRADLLAGFGVLAGLLCHIHAARSMGRRKFEWLGGLALASAIAMFSKESGIVILAAMAIYDFTFDSGGWRARVPGYFAAAAPVGAYLAARAGVLAALKVDPTPFTDNPLVGAGFWTAHLTAVEVLGRYVFLLLAPLRLSCDYSYNQIPLAGWSDWKALLALALCLGAVILAFLCRRRAPAAACFSLFFFAALAPASNLLFPIGTIMAERFLYLPAIALIGCAVLAWNAAERQWGWARSAGGLVLVLVCAACLLRTWVRNSDWVDNASLWASAVEAAPGSYKAHSNQAVFLSRGGDREAAAREAGRALAILDGLPDSRNAADAYATAARCYRQQGDALANAAQKAAWYRQALDAGLRGRRIDQARSRLAGHEVGTEAVYLELGRLYERLSERGRAFEALEYGRRVAQGDELCEELAALYEADGQLNRAAVTYLEALSINPDRAAIAGNLAAVYRLSDPAGCSLANGSLNLDCPLVRRDLCAAARNVAELYRGAGKRPAAQTVQAQAARNFGCAVESFGPVAP